MRLLIDTNIFLHAVNSGSPVHRAARSFLNSQILHRHPWCTTWPILYEFMRVATHARVLDRPLKAAEAFAFVQSVLDLEEVAILIPTDRHRDVLAEVLRELGQPGGNLFHDIHTATLMREHGVAEIVTADADFLQFPFVKVTHPLR